MTRLLVTLRMNAKIDSRLMRKIMMIGVIAINVASPSFGQSATNSRGKTLVSLITNQGASTVIVSAALQGSQRDASSPKMTESPVAANLPTPPSFDIVSVKPSAPDSKTRIRTLPDGYSATDIPLKAIISNAYGIRQDLISGSPGWTETTAYDIEAKWSDSASVALQKLPSEQRAAQLQLMLQALLADRFHLAVRHVPKEMPVYQLVVGKNGSKLKEADPNSTYIGGIKGPDGTTAGLIRTGPGQVIAQGLPISRLVTNLSYQVGRTVQDKTGLTGNYDFALRWAPDQNAANAGLDSGSDSSLPSLFTAIEEQLGLKLESTKGPVETLVIDHVEKPSPN